MIILYPLNNISFKINFLSYNLNNESESAHNIENFRIVFDLLI